MAEYVPNSNNFGHIHYQKETEGRINDIAGVILGIISAIVTIILAFHTMCQVFKTLQEKNKNYENSTRNEFQCFNSKRPEEKLEAEAALRSILMKKGSNIHLFYNEEMKDSYIETLESQSAKTDVENIYLTRERLFSKIFLDSACQLTKNEKLEIDSKLKEIMNRKKT